jgi:hypothetical protein
MLTAEDHAQIAIQLALTRRLSLGILLSLFPILGLGSIIAIWIGVRGRKKIEASGGKLVGTGLASCCVVLGTLGLIGNTFFFWMTVIRQ